VSALEKRLAKIERESPLLRQLSSLTLISPKNLAEKELDRLGFKRSEIQPGMGDPQADRLVAKYMGPLVEKVIGQIVTGAGWQDRSDAERAVILQGGVEAAKAERSQPGTRRRS
jgi:hypothetical protein